MKKTSHFLMFTVIIVCVLTCQHKTVLPKGEIVSIKRNFIGIDFDNDRIPNKQIEISRKIFMQITSANMECNLPVTLTADSAMIVSLDFGTHMPLILDSLVVQRHIDTFSWHR